MKKMFLALAISLLSLTALAKPEAYIFPNIYNYGTYVQIQVWNHTGFYVTCSGNITMRMQSGATQSEYFFENIMPRFSTFRTMYVRNNRDYISYVTHNIFCH